MKKIILIFTVLFISIVSFGQNTGSFNPVFGKQDFKDSLKFSKFLNNVGEDSVLTIDRVTKKLKFVAKGGGMTAFTFMLNYDGKRFLMYTNGVLTDSTASGVKDAYGLGGIRVVDSLGNVYIDGSGISGLIGQDTSYLTNGDSILNIRNTDGDIQSYNFAGGAGGIGSTFNPDTLEAAIALKLNISDTAAMLLPYRNKINLNTDSITSIHNQIVGLTSGLALKLNISDTAAILAVKVNKVDSISGIAGNYVTQYQRKKTSDSLLALIISSGGYIDSTAQVGDIYNKNSWANLNDFTDVGTGATISGNAINITGGTNVYSDYLSVKDTLLNQDFKIKIRFKINSTPTGTTNGIGIGVRGINNLNLIAKANMATGANAGRITLSDAISNFTIFETGTPIVPTIGDTIEFSLQKESGSVTASLNNLNDSSSIYSIKYYYPVFTAPSLQSTGRYSIFRFGGDFNVVKLNIQSNDRQSPVIGFVGDSKSQFGYVDNLNKTFVGLANLYIRNNGINTVQGFGGGSDQTKDILSRLPQIILAKPQMVFLAIGSNDKRAGVSNAVWFTNYKSITSQLVSAGIQVKHLLTFPENSFDFSAYVDSIISTYPNDYIDTWTPLKNGTALATPYNSGDGIHPNSVGHFVIFKQILKSGILDIFNRFKVQPNPDLPIGLGSGEGNTNISVGLQNTISNTTGLNLTAVGYGGLLANTTGRYNSAFGTYSLRSNTTGESNNAFGVNSLNKNTIGNENSAFGPSALTNNTTGINNSALGYGAMFSNLIGGYNTALGHSAMYFNTASLNTAVGYNALKNNTAGSSVAAVGYRALENSTADYNTALGGSAGLAITSGSQNTAVGFRVMYYGVAVTGIGNSGIGSNSLGFLTTGAYNTATGTQALLNNTTGGYNIGIGNSSGKYNTTASNKIFINSLDRVDFSGDTTASVFYADQNATSANQRTKIGGGGTVGINQYGTSTLAVDGSFATAYTATATSLTATIAHNVIVVTATGQTITLPTAVGITGRIYTIKLTAIGTGTVATTSSQTIDGATTFSLLAQYKYITVQSDGANWNVIGNN